MIDSATKEIVRRMLDEPDAEIEMFRSVIPDSDPNGTEFEPGKGKTIVLKTGGGANNVQVERVKIPGEK